MARKIYDIIPPKVAKKLENTIRELSSPVVAAPKRRKKQSAPIKPLAPIGKNNIQRERSGIFSKRNIFIGGGILVLLLAIYLYNSLQKATIEISPTMRDISLQEKVTADRAVKNINVVAKVIPAEYIEVEKENTQEFPATGTSSTDSKATGSIIIYNKMDPASSVTLLKGTHFLSDSGKYFVTLDKLTIPAAKSKSAPGSIIAKVQAKEVGTDYNIGASKFSVPKLSGTAYYYGIYAESKSKMVGGSTGRVKKVTKDDIEGAKDALTKSLFQDAQSSLQGSLTDNDILLEGATIKTIVSATSSEEVGAVADKFTESAKVKVSAMIFKKDDLQQFVRDYINSKLKDDEEFLAESLKIDYSPDLIDLQKGKEAINLIILARSYNSIDQNNLMTLLEGKSASQIKDVIDEKYGDNVSGVKVNLWPFWTTKAPNNNNKINIKLNFE